MLKYVAVGDPQGDNAQTLKAVQFINSIPSSQIDFVVFCGDIIGSANTITQNCKVPFYLAQGNHDGSNFGPQYYPDVKGYQIVIPQFNWQSYNWAQVDKTKPCLVFVHCPPIPCASCDSLHKCGQTMRAAQLDKLNMRACHSGHLHGHKVDILAPTTGAAKRLYVVESGMPTSTRCCSPNFRNQVGYARVDDAGNVCYKELDITKTWSSQTVNGEVVFDPSRCTGTAISTLTSITLSPSSISVGMNSSTQLTAVCKDQNGVAMSCPGLSWASSDASIVTVDNTGKITGIAIGTANITARSGLIVSNSPIVTVTPPATLASITISPSSASVGINSSIQLSAICKDQNNNTMTCPSLSWSSSNTSIATVDNTGKVTGIATGVVNITAASLSMVSNSSTITVTTAPSGIVVTSPTLGIIYSVGESRVVRWTHVSGTGANVKIELLKAGVLSKTISSSTPNDDAFAWTVPSVVSGNNYQVKVTSTTNTQIAGISPNFTIQGTTPLPRYKCSGSPNYQCVEDPNGQYATLAECQAACKPTTVKYKCSGSPNYQCVEDPNGQYATLVECQAACHIRYFTPEELKTYNGKNGQPAYVAVNGNVYDLTSSPTWPNGDHMSQHVAGNDLTNVFPHDISKLTPYTIVGKLVQTQTLTSITLTPPTISINANTSTQLSAICKDQNNNTMTCPSLSWSSSNTSIATVDSAGKVTGIASGTTNITAKSGSITSNVSVITVTQTVEKKFSIYDITQGGSTTNTGVMVLLDDAGTFTKDQACVEVCTKLGQI